MSYFEHRGCKLFYEEHGQGTPVVLIHGLGSSALDWEMQIPALAAHYRVVAMDVRGHGRSQKPHERYSIAGFADDVAALIEHLQLAPVHLIGISMGGTISFQFGVDRPQLLRSLTIVNSVAEMKANTPANCLMIVMRWTMSRLLSMDTIGKTLAKKLFPKPEQAGLRRKVEERWRYNDKRPYLAALNAIIGWGVRERLARITCPTLVITGDRDYYPISLKQAYVDELPNARLLVIKDSRHGTPFDQPEDLNRGLLAFLQEVENTAATPSKD